MEFLFVKFRQVREVFADGNDTGGETNCTLMLPPGEYRITLSGTGYEPHSHNAVLVGTTKDNPRVICFTEATVPVPEPTPMAAARSMPPSTPREVAATPLARGVTSSSIIPATLSTTVAPGASVSKRRTKAKAKPKAEPRAATKKAKPKPKPAARKAAAKKPKPAARKASAETAKPKAKAKSQATAAAKKSKAKSRPAAKPRTKANAKPGVPAKAGTGKSKTKRKSR